MLKHFSIARGHPKVPRFAKEKKGVKSVDASQQFDVHYWVVIVNQNFTEV
jgi:hypothetical protein